MKYMNKNTKLYGFNGINQLAENECDILDASRNDDSRGRMKQSDYNVRLNFAMKSVEGIQYKVSIVSLNEKRINDFAWAPNDIVYCGDYYPYISRIGVGEKCLKQNIHILKGYGYDSTAARTGKYPHQRINITNPNDDGASIAVDKNGGPDILFTKQRDTGGGSFTLCAFVVKDGLIQMLNFTRSDNSLSESHTTGFKPCGYLDDGTVAIRWWTNARPNAGNYLTVYHLDYEQLLLRFICTQKELD